MSEDFYDILGVSPNADEAEIKKAYREMATKYHPDVSDEPDAQEKFKKIQKAKQVLTDEEKRQAYDQMGHDRYEQAEKHGFDAGASGRGPGGMGGDPFGGMGGMGGGIGDIFEQVFGGSRQGRQRPQKGRDLRTTLRIDLEQAFEGVDKQITIQRPEHCTTCDGSGYPPDAEAQTCTECQGSGQQTQVQQTPLGRIQQTTVCRRCDGEGRIYDKQCEDCHGQGIIEAEATLTIEVPQGIRDGQTLRMEREGAPSANNGPNGDLLIDISIAEHETFDREGDNLRIHVPISFPQATFGDAIEVPTLDGAVELDIPAGTQSGETFRLKDRGMPRLRQRGYGDLFVQVQVVTPESLNEEQRDALEAFAEAGGDEIEIREGLFDKIKRAL